jgi:putative ABC transport system permease protein
MPGTENFFGMSFQQEGSTEMHTGRGLMVDENYDDVLGLELSKGRFFSTEFSTDTLSVVVNESAVKQMGITGDPIGKRLISPDDFLNAPDGGRYVYTIIGVVRDFHFQTLHEKIAPLYLIHLRKITPQDPLIAVKLNAANYQSGITAMGALWKKFVQDRPLHYNFLDEALAERYATEESTRKLFSVFSALAIIIACMGMIGLIAYTVQMRFREIGIRKVLGASASGILWLLGRNFLLVVLIASLIAIPVGWWAMHNWLENFAYRITIPLWVFLLATLTAVVIAAVNIALQALKAAWMNPLRSLRTE